MEPEVAFAAVEHDVVLLQVHRTAGEHAGPGGDRQDVDVLAHLDLVEIPAAGFAGDEALKIRALEPGAQGIADLVGRQKDAAQAVDGDRARQLQAVLLHRLPNLVGRQLRRLGGVKQPADGGAGAEQFLPVGHAREARIEKECVGFEHETVVVERRRPGVDHLDADARERAALGEMDLGPVSQDEFEFGWVAWPEGEEKGQGVGILVLEGENLAVTGAPKRLGLHWSSAVCDRLKGRNLHQKSGERKAGIGASTGGATTR